MPSLTDLTKEFQPKAERLLGLCAERGVIMRPYFTLRDPITQSKLWRQSRSLEEIEAKIKFLIAQNALYLANCLEAAGPQSGKWATNALPGESWHQWGEAIDCFWVVNGTAEWSTSLGGDDNGYHVYARIAKELELTPLGPTRIQDWAHVQRSAHKVTDQYSWAEIDAEMQNRYDRPNY